IGAGDIGYQTARRFSKEKHNIVLIESNEAIADFASNNLDAIVINGNGCSSSVLIEAGVKHTDVLASLTDNDEVNILACKIAKKHGVRTTIARVRNPEYISDTHIISKTELGVDYFLQPEKETAETIVHLIRQSNVTDVIEFEGGKLKFLGLKLDDSSQLLNKKLMDLSTELDNPPLTVTAIKRGKETIVPKGSDILLAGDQIYMVCAPHYQETAMEYLGKKKQLTENILIIGGGLTATFVASQLEGELNMKIIEKDPKKALELASLLTKPLVINGDGSNLELLLSENLESMDQFIAITGNDETNIITSIVAQHLGVKRTVTLIKKSDYLPLTPALGMDSVVSKQQITVNALTRYIKGEGVAKFAELPALDAEIVEFVVKEKSKITKKPIMHLKIPKGVVLGAILRDDKLIIPKGNTQIIAGDKVVVFSLPDSFLKIESFFE
ncbi:Trk system potassium transporter TrkA, partial [bacterium]